jgi:hypothetical protein
MRKTLAIALLAAIAAPGMLAAADNTRFPPIPADKQTAKQKEFIKSWTTARVRPMAAAATSTIRHSRCVFAQP